MAGMIAPLKRGTKPAQTCVRSGRYEWLAAGWHGGLVPALSRCRRGPGVRFCRPGRCGIYTSPGRELGPCSWPNPPTPQGGFCAAAGEGLEEKDFCFRVNGAGKGGSDATPDGGMGRLLHDGPKELAV